MLIDIIKDKFRRLVVLIISSGLLYVLSSQFYSIRETGEINVDKLLLSLWPLLFVIVFIYSRSKFGFGLATFYVVSKLGEGLMALSIYAYQLGIKTMFTTYPVSADAFIEVLVTLASGSAVALLYLDYWRNMLPSRKQATEAHISPGSHAEA